MKTVALPLAIVSLFCAWFPLGAGPLDADAPRAGDSQRQRPAENAASSLSVSSEPVDFGEVSVPGAYGGTGRLTVLVPPGTVYRISIGAGGNFQGGSRNVRRIEGGAALPYELFKDSSLTQPWGDADFDNTFAAGGSLAAVGSGQGDRIKVFGRIRLNDLPPPGAYADNILVTVSY